MISTNPRRYSFPLKLKFYAEKYCYFYYFFIIIFFIFISMKKTKAKKLNL